MIDDTLTAPKYAKTEPSRWAREEPTFQLRWKKDRAPTNDTIQTVSNSMRRLQQAWRVEHWVGNTIDIIEIEWRDVPTVGYEA